jgi:hypothetical protein
MRPLGSIEDKLLRYIEQLFVLCDVWWAKDYFGILDNVYLGQKVVMWFSEGQEC